MPRRRKPAPEPAAAPAPEPRPFVPNSKTKWVIYGVFEDASGHRRAITDETITSEEEANVKLVTYYMTKGRALQAVLIRLDYGRDVNGQRHVLRRAGEGRAWWE